MKKALYISAGITAMAVGVLGIVLPVLPTTPLLLLALYCFAKGSEKLTCWFQETWLYKKYLDEYVRTKTLTLKQKRSIQALASGVMIISFLLSHSPIIRVVLIVSIIFHNWFFATKIKTRKPEGDRIAQAREVPNEI